jgi:hypothetical protein
LAVVRHCGRLVEGRWLHTLQANSLEKEIRANTERELEPIEGRMLPAASIHRIADKVSSRKGSGEKTAVELAGEMIGEAGGLH